MSNTIYILGIVAWIVYNFYKAGKKITGSQKQSPAKKAQPSEPPAEEKDFGTLLEEILSGKQVAPAKPVVIAPAPPVTDRRSLEEVFDETEFDTETGYNKNTERKSSELISGYEEFDKEYERSSDAHSSHTDMVSEVEEETRSHWLAEMDIRKAIVYSEILKRPSY